ATEPVIDGDTMLGLREASILQIGAAMRLLYYFPRETAPLIAQRLRSLDVSNGSESDAWLKREERNHVHTDWFIKAVSWCKAPAIQKALDEIAKRTDDPEIKKVLAGRPRK